MLSGRYRLGARLGQGGMGEVFAAEDLRLGRPVAVKVLRAHLAADETVRERFEQEARTAARLSHPNVVSIFDTEEDDGLAYIVMERLPGTTLADELAGGPLEPERARQVAAQVLSALEAAHGLGVVHRDIKPANILTCPDGRVKVADFGIATAMDEAQSLTSTGLLIGTPAYLAPERLAGAPATASTDLYSLAAMLYQCLTGRQPFEADSTLGLIAAVREQDPRPVRSLRPGVDPALAGLIERTLAKEPEKRPASAAEMARLLEPALFATQLLAERAGQTALLPLVPPKGPSPRAKLDKLQERARKQVDTMRRHRAPLAFLAAAVLALSVALPLAAASSGPARVAPREQARHVATTAATNPTVTGVPDPLADAISRLERAVG